MELWILSGVKQLEHVVPFFLVMIAVVLHNEVSLIIKITILRNVLAGQFYIVHLV